MIPRISFKTNCDIQLGISTIHSFTTKMIHPTYPSSPGPFNVYQEHASANSKQHMHSSDVVSSQVVLDVDDWSSITISPNQDYFEWNHHKYHLELNYLQAYRGVLLVALRKLEESHTGASPLAIRVTGNLARKLLPSGQLPEPSYSTYLAYREEVVREMYHMLKYEKSPTDTVVTQPHGSPYTNVAALVSPHRPHSAPVERVIITNPMDVAIQQPFILYRGCQYRLRYDLSAELKAIPTNTIDAMIKFNPHLYECDPPAVIKVVGFIASQVAPENFVRSSSQYIAYRTEVIEMLPSLVSIPVDKDFDELQDHHLPKKARIESHESMIQQSLLKDVSEHMETMSVAELLEIIGRAQAILKSKLGCSTQHNFG